MGAFRWNMGPMNATRLNTQPTRKLAYKVLQRIIGPNLLRSHLGNTMPDGRTTPKTQVLELFKSEFYELYIDRDKTLEYVVAHFNEVFEKSNREKGTHYVAAT